MMGKIGPALLAACLAQLAGGCVPAPGAGGGPVFGVAFETLQTEYWVAGFGAIRDELARRDIGMLQAIAYSDSNRQLEQVKSFIARKVDGIIIVPKDAKTCIPMIRAANAAGTPAVLFNRPAARTDARSVAVVADNFALAKATVEHLIGEARRRGGRHEAMVVLGDLGDINAVGRRDGFDAAVAGAGDIIDVVARVPSEWNQEKAQAGVVNALQAHPGIRLVFTSSDFLFPSIVSALKAAGKYRKIGDPGHVILGGFDGDATAYAMLREGYLDATGVQDVYFEASESVRALIESREGKEVPPTLLDPGFVIHQGNLAAMAPRMWGANVGRR